jgi:hypothetical protein
MKVDIFVFSVLLEVGRACAQARPSGLGFLLHKTQSLMVGLGPKLDFFTYVVKPEPDKSPTCLENFSSLKKPKP